MIRAPRRVVGLLIVGLAGCGGGAPDPKSAPPPPPPPQPRVAQNAAVEPKAAPKKVAAKPAAKPKPFANEDPANVLTVVAAAEPMTAVGSPVDPHEKLTVALGVFGSDSSRLTVQRGRDATTKSTEPALSVTLPEGFQAIPAYGFAPDGFPNRIKCTADEALMAYVPGGLARVGTDKGPPEAGPQFVVELEPYYIDVTEVTVGMYERYRADLKDKKKRAPPPVPNLVMGSDFPALNVSFSDAYAYVKWAGKELPTEAEFEKAARGPQGFRAPWGDGRPVWPTPRTPQTLSPVGTFAGDTSPYGVHDLAGNAREWCNDWYMPTAHAEASAARPPLRGWTGPKRTSTGNQRVVKGGGADWAVWHRAGLDMSDHYPDLGFRCVLRIDPNAPKSKPETAAPAEKNATKKPAGF